jgi:predicted neuraminidase
MSDPINSVPAPEPRYARRLPDKILTAFHQACDQGDIEVAVLLDVLEFMVSRTHNLPAGIGSPLQGQSGCGTRAALAVAASGGWP